MQTFFSFRYRPTRPLLTQKTRSSKYKMAGWKFKIFLLSLILRTCAGMTIPLHGQYSKTKSSGLDVHFPRFEQRPVLKNRFVPNQPFSLQLKGGGVPNSLFSPLLGFLKGFGGVASSAIVVIGCNLLGFAITLGTGTHLVTDLLGTGAIGISAAVSFLLSDSPITCRSDRFHGFFFPDVSNHSVLNHC